MTKTVDVVVIGGGLAAMKSAVTAAKSGLEVLIIVKRNICSGASFYPMMDMVACQSSTGVPGEDAEYLAEILDCSLGMADETMNRIYISTIRDRVKEFPEIGVTEYKLTEPKVACFAVKARPTYVWSDWIKIRKNMRAIIDSTPNLNLMENTTVLALLKDDERVSGVLIKNDDGISSIACKSVVLATGGMGDLYKYNLNTSDVSGDGQAMALAAGAKLINVEFNQFIPGFVRPAYKTVFRETTVPYMEKFLSPDGRDLLAEILPDKSEREECLRLRSKHGPFTHRTIARYFDFAMMRGILDGGYEEQGFAINYKPEIADDESTFVRPYYNWLIREHKVDLAKDTVYIAPFYHAANGGVLIGHNCETSIKGLFACGEVSGGIHGADRQGGQSTGSCLVFGYLAGKNAAEYAQGQSVGKTVNPKEALNSTFVGSGNLEPEYTTNKIRNIMFKHGNVMRSEKPLKDAIAEIKTMQEDYAPLKYMEGDNAKEAFKARNFLILSQALLNAMLNRQESRGSHYRDDFPNTDPKFERRFTVSLSDGKIKVESEKSV